MPWQPRSVNKAFTKESDAVDDDDGDGPSLPALPAGGPHRLAVLQRPDHLALLAAHHRGLRHQPRGLQGLRIGSQLVAAGLAAACFAVFFVYWQQNRPMHEQVQTIELDLTKVGAAQAQAAKVRALGLDRLGVRRHVAERFLASVGVRRFEMADEEIGAGEVPQLLAVNKIDLVNFDQQVFDRIVGEYASFAASLGFHTMVPIPVSGRFGDNVAERSLRMDWYAGPTLMRHLETVDVERDARGAPFRMPVQYVNRPNSDFRGYCGTVASGSIEMQRILLARTLLAAS